MAILLYSWLNLVTLASFSEQCSNEQIQKLLVVDCPTLMFPFAPNIMLR